MKMRTCVNEFGLLGLIACVLFLGACNTWKGAGKDVERTGEKMQGHE